MSGIAGTTAAVMRSGHGSYAPMITAELRSD
jgi:hypothetical protein